LNEVLPLVGEKVVQPVVEAVSEVHGNNASGAPALVLIPTGLLSLLPLHAAPFDAGGAGRTLIDEFDTYYGPSALALEHSRATLASLPADPPRLFGVGNPLPLPAGVDSLTFARVEVEEATRLFADAEAVFETEATREAVEGKLDTAAYLHFSCHGHFDAENPLASCLILSGGERLMLSSLLAAPRLGGTRLAVLSACKTAVTDFRHLPEEAVGLPSGFLQLGAVGVIGSLWAVNDLSTALLMLKFYDYHLRGDAAGAGGRTPPARALRHAQLWLRDVTNAELSTLFAKFKQTAPDAPERVRMPYDLAKKNFTRYTLGAPSGRPFAHPYYWAAFILAGDWTPLDTSVFQQRK
jgi:CHAT domain-containing protein